MNYCQESGKICYTREAASAALFGLKAKKTPGAKPFKYLCEACGLYHTSAGLKKKKNESRHCHIAIPRRLKVKDQQDQVPDVSRKAQLMMLSVFAFGSKSEVVFRNPQRLTIEAKAAIDELVTAGLIACKQDSHGVLIYKGTEKAPMPARVWKFPKPQEKFNLLDKVV